MMSKKSKSPKCKDPDQDKESLRLLLAECQQTAEKLRAENKRFSDFFQEIATTPEKPKLSKTTIHDYKIGEKFLRGLVWEKQARIEELEAQVQWLCDLIRETGMSPVSLDPSERRKCPDCGKEISELRRADSVYCLDCGEVHRKRWQRALKKSKRPETWAEPIPAPDKLYFDSGAEAPAQKQKWVLSDEEKEQAKLRTPGFKRE